MSKQKLLNIILFIVALFGLAYIVSEQKFFRKDIVLSSPVPDFLTFFKNDQVTTLSIWVPIKNYAEAASGDLEKPEISAKSALIYDLTTNRILFEKNPSEKMAMASLTKIMTSVVALESYGEEDIFRVSQEDLVGENSMGLAESEELNLKELLYGLVLLSGNDAAETIARKFSGGRDSFIVAMNNKAKSLGALSTNFTNPSGLEGDGEQYSTAYDLLIMTKYAMNFDLFRQIVSTVEFYIAPTGFHKEYLLYNETNLLTSYPGVKGVKTGYTPEAGFCLVSYLDYEGHEIIGIILGSNNRREEMKEILDYSLKTQGIIPPPHE